MLIKLPRAVTTEQLKSYVVSKILAETSTRSQMAADSEDPAVAEAIFGAVIANKLTEGKIK